MNEWIRIDLGLVFGLIIWLLNEHQIAASLKISDFSPACLSNCLYFLISALYLRQSACELYISFFKNTFSSFNDVICSSLYWSISIDKCCDLFNTSLFLLYISTYSLNSVIFFLYFCYFCLCSFMEDSSCCYNSQICCLRVIFYCWSAEMRGNDSREDCGEVGLMGEDVNFKR